MEKQMKQKAEYPVVPHAYSFVYHQIMGDQPPPHVPVLMNLFYPPTQPSMARCIEFGRRACAMPLLKPGRTTCVWP